MSEMLQLRAWLVDSEPEVWRRLIVDPRLTLEQLHTVLQVAFGWTNSHMHQFHEEDGRRYAKPNRYEDALVPKSEQVIDERKVQLAGVFDRKEKRIAYEYDFGDSWIHAVELEDMVDGETVEYPPATFVTKGRGFFSGKARAAICIAGARSGPPEDCGGLDGYQHILELKQTPPHPTARRAADDRELLAWLGEWEPDGVYLSEINQNLGRVRVKKAFAG